MYVMVFSHNTKFHILSGKYSSYGSFFEYIGMNTFQSNIVFFSAKILDSNSYTLYYLLLYNRYLISISISQNIMPPEASIIRHNKELINFCI